MRNIDNKDERMIRYLLGDLSSEERKSIEEQYFQDDQFFKEILVIEGELIDEYVCGELSPEERVKFEAQIFSTPQGRRKVEASRTIMSAILEEPSKVAKAGVVETHTSWWQSFRHRLRGQNRVWQISFASVSLLFILGAGWLIVENMRLRSQLRSTQVSLQQKGSDLQRLQGQTVIEQQQQRQQEAEWLANIQQTNEALQRERIERENAERLAQQKENQGRQNLPRENLAERERPTAIATYVFSFNPVRGTSQQDNPLIIGAGQKNVRFQIDLGRTASSSYRISLQTVEGSEVWGGVKKTQATKAGNSVRLILPTDIFTRQDYILTVTPLSANGEAESIAEYSFRVVRKD